MAPSSSVRWRNTRISIGSATSAAPMASSSRSPNSSAEPSAASPAASPDRSVGPTPAFAERLIGSRLDERNGVLLHPRDLKRHLVEQTATSELDLVLRTVGGQLLHVSQKLPHPRDAGARDADVRLETVRVQQQAKP